MNTERDSVRCETVRELHLALIHMMRDGVAVAVEGKIALANNALEHMAGGPVTGAPLDQLLRPVRTVRDGVQPQDWRRAEFRTLRNAAIPVEFSRSPVHYEGKKADLYVIRDVSREVEMAEAAEICELRYTEILSVSPAAFFTLSPRGIIQDVNRAALNLLGYEINQIVKHHASVLFPKSDRGRSAGDDLISAAVGGKSVTDVEVQMVKADGTPVWVSVTTYPLKTKGDRIEAIMLMAIDINRRRVAEQRAAEERDRANLYLEVMTHDLNNINQELVFALGLLAESVELNDEAEGLLEQTRWNIRRSARMIRSMHILLTLQTRPPDPEPVDISNLFMAAVETVRQDLPWKTITVNHDIPDDKFIIAGNQYVREVFFNTLHNAAVYDQSEDVSIDVHVERDQSRGIIRVVIEDRGPGVPDNLKNAVFRRTDEDARRLVGRGLGLTLVNTIMQSIDGSVWLEDRVQGQNQSGTRVVLEFREWIEKAVLPCGRRTCITFYKSDHCLFCEPSLEILLDIMETMGVPRRHLEIINVDDPTAEPIDEDLAMLPIARICDKRIYGFFSEDEVRAAIMNLMLQPCYPE
ncbi:MAG: PAS domain S-box protein [Candidatus Thorarchaeota archaeon]